MRRSVTAARGVRDEFASSGLPGFGNEAGHVGFHRFRGYEEPFSDLGVGKAARHQQEDVHLPAGNAEAAHLRRHLGRAAA